MIRTLELPTAGGVFELTIELADEPLPLAALVPVAHGLCDVIVSEANAAHPKPVTCQKGCGACCRQMIPLSPPEVFHLGEAVGATEPGARGALGRRFGHIAAALAEAGLQEELLSPTLDDDSAAVAAQRYFELGLPCPFLVDESCGAHAIRPTVCREFNVTTPPVRCDTPFDTAVERVPMPRPMSAALIHASHDLVGTPLSAIPLSLAPLWAERNAEAGSRRLPGEQLLDAFLAHLFRS